MKIRQDGVYFETEYCTSGRRGVPEWGDPGSLKQKENLKEKAMNVAPT